VRNAIAEDNPAIFAPSLASPGERDMNRFVSRDFPFAEDRDRAVAGVIRENPSRSARRIFCIP